jgi:hypothetical protein
MFNRGASTEVARFDTSGRFLIGINAATNNDSYVQAFKATGNDATITVGNVATSASGLCRYDFAPSNKVVGARIECHATEDFSTGANRTADLVFITRKDGTLSERLSITSTGQFVVGTNPTVNSGNIAHIEAPTSFNSGETIIAVVGDNGTAGPRLLLQNKNTGGSAHGEILGVDAGGQSTSSIRFYNTDQSNNYGEIAFGTRNQSGVPPEDRMRIESDGQLVVHGGGTKYAGWAGGTPLNVTSMAMINVGNAGTSNWGWGLRGNSGDTQWCLERIKDNSGFNDVYIKFRVYNNGNYLFAGSNSSDRDLKENILDITGTSLDKIKQLRPRTFNFIESEGYSTETKTGFIAQEVASVIPSIANGTDGQKNMGVDYNGLVAHLVKALQEATTEIETLKTKVAALEGS